MNSQKVDSLNGPVVDPSGSKVQFPVLSSRSNSRCWTWLFKDSSQFPLTVNALGGAAVTIAGFFVSKPYNIICYVGGVWLFGSQLYPCLRIRQIAPRAEVGRLVDRGADLILDEKKEDEILIKTKEELKNTKQQLEALIEESNKNAQLHLKQLEDKNEEIKSVVAKLEVTTKDLNRLQEIYNRLKATTDSLMQHLKEINQTNQTLKINTLALRASTSKVDIESGKLEKELSEFSSANTFFDQEDEEFKTTANQLTSQVTLLKEFFEKIKGENASFIKKVESLATNNQILTKSLTEIKERESNLVVVIDKLKKEIEELKPLNELNDMVKDILGD